MSRLQADADSAQVQFPPPIMLFLCLALGGLIHWFHPLSLVPQKFRWLGYLLIALGVGTILYSAKMFQQAQTSIEPWKTTSHIITTGIYGKTRNPIYLAFLIAGLGVAVTVNSLWIALTLLPLIFLLQKFVIEKEEKYLEQKFQQEYFEYKSKVRRWI